MNTPMVQHNNNIIMRTHFILYYSCYSMKGNTYKIVDILNPVEVGVLNRRFSSLRNL